MHGDWLVRKTRRQVGGLTCTELCLPKTLATRQTARSVGQSIVPLRFLAKAKKPFEQASHFCVEMCDLSIRQRRVPQVIVDLLRVRLRIHHKTKLVCSSALSKEEQKRFLRP